MKKLIVYVLTNLLLFAPVVHAWDALAFVSRAGVNPTGLVIALTPLHSTTQDYRDRSRQDNDFEQKTGVNQPALTSSVNASAPVWDFDGSDFIQQAEIDSEQGALSYTTEGGDSSFTDAGQVFTGYAGSGTAIYRIVVTDDDSDISWGYFGAAVSATEIKVYDDIALSSTGWLGDGGTGTPDSYEIYKVIGSTNFTGDQTHWFAGVKPVDGHPTSSEGFYSRYLGAGNLRSMFGLLQTNGTLRFRFSGNGTAVTNETTTNAVFSDGAQASYTQVGFSKDGTEVIIYVNGLAVASNSAVHADPIFDTPAPFYIGLSEVGGSGYLNGQLGPYLGWERTLSAAEIQRLYLQALEEGLIGAN